MGQYNENKSARYKPQTMSIVQNFFQLENVLWPKGTKWKTSEKEIKL